MNFQGGLIRAWGPGRTDDEGSRLQIALGSCKVSYIRVKVRVFGYRKNFGRARAAALICPSDFRRRQNRVWCPRVCEVVACR